MTNLTDITNLTDSALDALLGVDAEAEAEAERAEHNRRSLADQLPTAHRPRFGGAFVVLGSNLFWDFF